jgi:hypothetical protein
MHSVLFCEPYSTVELPEYEGNRVMLTDTMYNTVLDGPSQILDNESTEANAYVFGELFPLYQYVELAAHGNDGAQTGFVDVDHFNAVAAQNVMDIVLEEYGDEGLSWRSRDALLRVRSRLPHVLFIGETVGGDVGAVLYGHRNAAGDIDSLIIDNNYFFNHQDDDSE